MLQHAIDLARQAHQGQYRKDGSPYIDHPLAVMGILQSHDFCDDVLVCAMLHDVTEDCNIKNVDIREIFGDRIGFIVNALSKNRLPSDEQTRKNYLKQRAHASLEEYIDYRFMMYVNRIYVGIIADPRIMFVKMADQIHNLQTMDVFSDHKKKQKLYELTEYFVPIYEKSRQLLTPMYDEKRLIMIKQLHEHIERVQQTIT